MGERERLIARIRQIRGAAESIDHPTDSRGRYPDRDRLPALEERITRLEALVQGLQDSVHRESSRQSERITELEGRIQPRAVGKALSDDARARGL
jgi:hypothetical protein